MFKKFLPILIIFTSLNVFSQKQEFKAAIYGGITACQIDGDNYSGYNKAGALFGGFVNRNFNKKLAWQLGLRYIQKGSKKSGKEKGAEYTARLHYAEIPVTIRYFHYKKLDFEGGLAFAYPIKALESFNKSEFINANPEFNKLDLSSIFGINYQINEKLSLSAAMEYSILATRPSNPKAKSYINKGQRNNIVYFTLNYKFKQF